MGIKASRMGDSVNFLESFGMAKRLSKNVYEVEHKFFIRDYVLNLENSYYNCVHSQS